MIKGEQRGVWSIERLLRIVPCAPGGFFFNPLSWNKKNLCRCVKRAQKKGLVKVKWWSKSRLEVILIKTK